MRVSIFTFISLLLYEFIISILVFLHSSSSLLYLWIKNLCVEYFPSHIFTRVIFEQTYKPISFLYCILIEKFGMNPIPHKIVSATFYAVFGASTFLFLNELIFTSYVRIGFLGSSKTKVL